MASPADLQISRIKLRELRRLRDRLDEHYSALERRLAATAAPPERLRLLYDGLRGATFAQKSLHPETANLDALFFEGRVGTASADVVAAWLQRLERELAQGRLRAEFAHAFGQMLEEAARSPESADSLPPADPPPLPDDTTADGAGAPEYIACLIDAWNAEILEQFREGVRQFAAKEALAPPADNEVKVLLSLVAADPTRPPEVRRQAAAAAANPTQTHEYAGVLTILLDNLAEWDWPEEGVARRVLWLRDKPRRFLQEDLVTALFLQLLGLRWGSLLKRLVQEFVLQDVKGPLYGDRDAEYSSVAWRHRGRDSLFLSMVPPNLETWVRAGRVYDRDQNTLEEQLRLLQAEIDFHHAAFPARPRIVVQTDLRDYYPSVSHPIILRLLERIGFPPLWLDFVRKYLAVRVRAGDEVRVVRRGLPLDHVLGAVLAEFLLLPLEVVVFQAANVRLLRVIDDICFFADSEEGAERAWQLVVEFCGACGLEVNTEKSGSVVLGGAAAPGLPSGPVRWGLLRLGADGAWRLDEQNVRRLEEWARRQAEGSASTLRMVRRYNEAMQFILRSLGLTVPLGPDHLEQVGHRLAQLHDNLFGPGRGIVAEVRSRLSRQFRNTGLQRQGLPEALLYWPVTAGGLGISHPLLTVTAHQKGMGGVSEVRPPPDITHDPGAPNTHQWASFYHALIRRRVPATNPEATPGLAHLLQDFIARGSEVGGRKQVRLRPYWQWVLYTYGPPLLESVGTFRFLLTELVPLGLIFDAAGPGIEDSAGAAPETDDTTPF